MHNVFLFVYDKVGRETGAMLSSLTKFLVQLLIHLSSTRFRNCWVEKYQDSEALILLDGTGLDSFLQHSIPAGLEAT